MTTPHRRTMRARPVIRAEDAAPLPEFIPRVQLSAEDRATIRTALDKRARTKLRRDEEAAKRKGLSYGNKLKQER